MRIDAKKFCELQNTQDDVKVTTVLPFLWVPWDTSPYVPIIFFWYLQDHFCLVRKEKGIRLLFNLIRAPLCRQPSSEGENDFYLLHFFSNRRCKGKEHWWLVNSGHSMKSPGCHHEVYQLVLQGSYPDHSHSGTSSREPGKHCGLGKSW